MSEAGVHKWGPEAQGLGRPRGGLTTKIHAAGDSLGLPMRLIVGPGQESDIARAHELIADVKPDHVLADKGYDADHLIEAIVESGAEGVIAPRRCRKTPRSYDKALDKERSQIERVFNKVKQFRRVATRYDELLVNVLGFVKIAGIAIWIR